MADRCTPSIAVIGCGHWGINLVRNFAALQALAAVCDINPHHAEQAAATFLVPVSSWQEILDNHDIIAVVIATPAVSHYQLTKQALLAGKHVFVEKPMTLNLQHTQKLHGLAEQTKRVLMVGHLMLFHPAFQAIQGLVKTGKIGNLQYIYAHRMDLGRVNFDENALWNFAPHDISMILNLIQAKPLCISSSGACYLQPGIFDIATIHLEFPNNIRAHVISAWLNPEKERKLVVIGTTGMLVFNDCLAWSEKLKFYPGNYQNILTDGSFARQPPENVALEAVEPLRTECEHFLECLALNRAVIASSSEAIRVAEVLSSAHEQLTTVDKLSLAR